MAKQRASQAQKSWQPHPKTLLQRQHKSLAPLTEPTQPSLTLQAQAESPLEKSIRAGQTNPTASVQPKLAIAQLNAQDEQGTHKTDQQVVRELNSPGQALRRQVQAQIQMPIVQGFGASTGGTVSAAFESQLHRAQSGGQSLEPGLQRSMGSAMGADFSQVKVHTDSTANALSQSIQAKAFTTGPDIFFKRGEYNPSSRNGQELIAHELTHTVQQGAAVQRQVTDTIQRVWDETQTIGDPNKPGAHKLWRQTSQDVEQHEAGWYTLKDPSKGWEASDNLKFVGNKLELPTTKDFKSGSKHGMGARGTLLKSIDTALDNYNKLKANQTGQQLISLRSISDLCQQWLTKKMDLATDTVKALPTKNKQPTKKEKETQKKHGEKVKARTPGITNLRDLADRKHAELVAATKGKQNAQQVGGKRLVHVSQGQGGTASLTTDLLYSNDFQNCTPIFMYNAGSQIGGLFHFSSMMLATQVNELIAITNYVQPTMIEIFEGATPDRKDFEEIIEGIASGDMSNKIFNIKLICELMELNGATPEEIKKVRDLQEMKDVNSPKNIGVQAFKDLASKYLDTTVLMNFFLAKYSVQPVYQKESFPQFYATLDDENVLVYGDDQSVNQFKFKAQVNLNDAKEDKGMEKLAADIRAFISEDAQADNLHW